MNCVECLNELATGSLRDLQPTSSVMEHCERCSDCGPLLTALRDREYNAATTLNTLHPMSDPIRIAENAAMVAHRRRVGKVVTFITGGVLVATIWTSLFLTSFGRGLIGFDRARGLASLRTETIQLQCLSPEQAGDIISPYVRSHGSTYYVSSSGLPVITVRGTADELAKARELIGSFETDGRAACRNDLRIDLGKLRELENLRELEKLGPALAPLRDLVPPASPDPAKKK
jgi:hypothetical protein